jgi:hypothetical protein
LSTGKKMCDAFEAIMFVTAMIYEEQSQSDALFSRLFTVSEEKIHI